MNQNDYVILFDEKGTPYIAHAGWFDNAKNAARNAANAVGNAAQQVANRAKGVGRGVRTNHKYILKVNENGKTRYFYKPEEVKAYYEAKRKGIKNPAEYAQKAADTASNTVDAVKNATSNAVDVAKNAASKAVNTAGNTIDNKTKDLRIAASRVVNDATQSLKERASDTVEKITGSNAKKNLEDSKRAVRDATNAAESYAMKNGKRNEDLDADVKSAKRSEDFNQFMYDKSIRGQAEKTASNARDTASSAYNKAKDAANNTVNNAKNAYERMKGEFRQRTGADLKERAQTAEQEYRDAEAERRKAAGQFSSDVDRDLASQKALKKNPNSAHAQSERDQAAAAVRKSGEEYYKEGGALDTVSKARDKMNEAQKEYNDFKESHSPKAMIDQAKNAIVDKAKDIAGYDERERARQLRSKANAEYERAPTSNEAREAIANATGAETAYNKTPLGMIENAKKAVSSAIKPVQGMIDNARSSTAKAVNEAWDKIPKNADGTVNPFDPKFQSTYNDWKNRKDKYDNSLTGRAKEAAEKATDSVMDMIDQAKKAVKGNSGSNLTREQEQTNTGTNQAKRTQEEMNEIRNRQNASNLAREQEQTNTGTKQAKRTQEEMNEMRRSQSQADVDPTKVSVDYLLERASNAGVNTGLINNLKQADRTHEKAAKAYERIANNPNISSQEKNRLFQEMVDAEEAYYKVADKVIDAFQ